MGQGLLGRLEVKLVALHLDRARSWRVHPEQGKGDIGTASSDQPRKPEDLAAAQVEGHVGEHTLQAEAFDLQDHLALGMVPSGKEVGGVPTHHLAYQRVLADFGDGPG